MSEKVRVQSPEVITFAEKARVDLSTVVASAADGRVSKNDVLRRSMLDRTGLPGSASNEEIIAATGALIHVAKQRREAAEAEAAQRQIAASVAAASAHAAPRVAANGPAYALNPRADAARQVLAEANIAPKSAPPTLFASGDLPTFTASGIPVDRLLDVPTQARHALASALTQAAAFEIYSKCTEGEPEINVNAEQSASEYADHPGNLAYGKRVAEWQKAEAEAAIDEDAWLAQFDRDNR